MGSWTQSGQTRMVRKGDYKIQIDMMGTGYLYNLKEDPAELRNLWDEPDYLQIKADMLACLAAAALRAADPIPAPHNRYRTKLHQRGIGSMKRMWRKIRVCAWNRLLLLPRTVARIDAPESIYV